MNYRERHKQLTDDIENLITDFEKETGMLVSDEIRISRAGCANGYRIYGVRIATSRNSEWKETA